MRATADAARRTFAPELLLLEPDTLRREVLGEDWESDRQRSLRAKTDKQGRTARVGLVATVLAVDGPRELLGTVVLVQEVVGDLLEVREVRVEQRRAEAAKVAVLGVVDLDDAPRVATRADELATDLNLLLGSNDGERKQGLRRKWDRISTRPKRKVRARVRSTRSSLLSAIVSSSSSSWSYGKL